MNFFNVKVEYLNLQLQGLKLYLSVSYVEDKNHIVIAFTINDITNVTNRTNRQYA